MRGACVEQIKLDKTMMLIFSHLLRVEVWGEVGEVGLLAELPGGDGTEEAPPGQVPEEGHQVLPDVDGVERVVPAVGILLLHVIEGPAVVGGDGGSGWHHGGVRTWCCRWAPAAGAC